MNHLTTARWHLLNGPAPWGQDTNKAVLDVLNDKLGYAPPGHQEGPISALPSYHDQSLVALVLGHGRPIDEGNVGAGGVSEEEYNFPLIGMVNERLIKRGIRTLVVPEYPGTSYSEAMRWLADFLQRKKVTAAVEFHFNASTRHTAKGHEVLHWENSTRGVNLAASINSALNEAFPMQINRGLKPKVHSDRGALFLSLTHCPAVIVEPFFGDNQEEWDFFSQPENIERLAEAYAKGIARWVESTEVAA